MVQLVKCVKLENKIQRNNIFQKLNILNVFTITFDQFNASLLNKSIHSFLKKLTSAVVYTEIGFKIKNIGKAAMLEMLFY